MLDRAISQVLSPSGVILLALGIAIWLLALLPPRWRRVWGLGWLGGSALSLCWNIVDLDQSGWAYIKPAIYAILPLLLLEKGLYGPKAIHPHKRLDKPHN